MSEPSFPSQPTDVATALDEPSISDASPIDIPTEQIVTGNTSHTRPENRAFYPALDGLRAVAFLMVFCNHYCGLPWGWAGVDLFFVLSGFLITGILFDSRDDSHRVRNFYVRRTLRIFPLYYAVMLLLIPFTYRQLSWSWLVWPAYLGNYARYLGPYVFGSPLQSLGDFQPMVQIGIHGHHQVRLFLGHFWTLCVEEQFYLIWPWIIFWIRDRRKLLWICAASVPLCVAARIAGQHWLPTWMLEHEVLARATPFRLDALLVGGLLALWMRGGQAKAMLRAVRIALPVAVALLLIFVLWKPSRFYQQPYHYPWWTFTWGLLAIDLLSVLTIAVAIQPGSLMYRVLHQRPLRWLGRISYGAYVLHDIPHLLYISVARRVFPHHLQRASVGLAFISTCILAWLSYRFFEGPFLNLKERWTVRRQYAQ